MGIFNKTKNIKSDDGSQAVKSSSDKKESMKNLYQEEDKQVKPASSQKEMSPKKEAKTSGRAYRVLVKPLITEKASFLGAENKYLFAVSIDANKIEVAKAIEEVYKVKPVSVNIIKMKGKISRYGRSEGRKKDWKKAIVTLPEGQTIKVYEGV